MVGEFGLLVVDVSMCLVVSGGTVKDFLDIVFVIIGVDCAVVVDKV